LKLLIHNKKTYTIERKVSVFKKKKKQKQKQKDKGKGALYSTRSPNQIEKKPNEDSKSVDKKWKLQYTHKCICVKEYIELAYWRDGGRIYEKWTQNSSE
jgi:hypothetical protein